MLAGIKIQVKQEITKLLILEWTLISKTLLPILISNKEFTEDGILMASQSQKLLKLLKMENNQRHQSKLPNRTTRNSKPPLLTTLPILQESQLPRTFLRQMKSLSQVHQLAPVILKMPFKLHL
jgi:hypothetical protein